MEGSEEATFNWQAAVSDTFSNLSQQIVDYSPQLLGAIGVLLIGWLIAHTLSLSTRKLIQGLDALFAKFARMEGIHQEKIQSSYASIISRIVFWVVMLFFLAVVANILGWDIFSGWLDSIVSFLPGLISGLIIMLGGFLLSNLAKAGIISAAHKSGLSQSTMIARAVQSVIIFSAIIIGVEQIGLNVGFLSNIIVAIVAILLAGAALAFSLGARDMVANIIGAQYTRKYCRVGDQVRIGDVEGEIIELSQAFIVLETRTGQAIIPAKYFHEQVSFLQPGNR
jgi:hypothetical protein